MYALNLVSVRENELQMVQTFGYKFAIKQIIQRDPPTCHTTFSSAFNKLFNEVMFKSIKYVCNMSVPNMCSGRTQFTSYQNK
jgi:hypothetical protein